MKKISKKTLLLCVFAVLLAGGATLCAVRWKAWFGQPDESPYQPSAYPERILLTPGNKGEMSRNVSWMCDTIIKDSWLELIADNDTVNMQRIAADGEVFASRAGKGAYYCARLQDLKPHTRYSYRVATGDSRSAWHDFQTSGVGNRDFSFIYIGDLQDSVQGKGNEYLRTAFANHPEAELLISAGDLTDRPRDADWAQTFVGLDSIAGNIPVLAVTGNHDYLKGVVSKLEKRFSLVFSYFLESKIADNQVYRLRYGNAEFFLLDSFRELPYLWTQRKWLQESLAASDAPWKIVVIHHPLYSLRGNNNLMQKWAFRDVIESGNVSLVLQGHEHNYARKGDGTAGPVYVISHCSPKNYSHKSDEIFDVVDFDSRYYQYVEAKDDTLRLTTYRVYDSAVVDKVEILRKASTAAAASGK